MLEKDFQTIFIKKIKDVLPGCLVLKNDPSQIQGIPDWLVIYKSVYIFIEIKRKPNSKKQPNQEYWLQYINDIGGYGFIVNQKTESEVLKKILKIKRCADGI